MAHREVAADAGYGDNITFRLELAARGWQYAVAVTGTTSDYRELKTGLGLDHFEGRSYLGWHRHVTLAVLAQAFRTLLRSDPKVPAPG